MSYTFVKSLVATKTNPARYIEHDMSTMDLNDFHRDYFNAHIELLHIPTGETRYVYYDTIRTLIGVDSRPRSLNDWLGSIGNQTLPTTTAKPNLEPMLAKYNEVFRAGYSVTPTDINRHPDSNIPKADRRDLLLRKPGVDYMSNAPYLLASVNGMIHRVIGSTYGFYIPNGWQSATIANHNRAGLISFRELGPLTTIKITPNMVYKTRPDQEYRNFAYVRLPESVEGKTVLLVLGGYLHALDGLYSLINERTLKIDFNNLLFPDRIYDSINRIDLSSLELDGKPNNDKHYAIKDLYADEKLLAYLTLPQSFIVIVNSPNVYVQKHAVGLTRLPGRFVVRQPLKPFPLFSALGRCYDYLSFPKDERIVLACDENRKIRYNFATGTWKREASLDNTRYSSWPWDWAEGHLLEIGRY